MHLTPDQRADRLAARHHGLLPRVDALAAGLTARQIERRLASGRWVLVAPGLYRSASVAVTWQQRALAACLAGSPGTVASHLTAAALHGLGTAPARPHVIAPRSSSGRAGLAIVHRLTLDPHDRTRVAGIPCTSAGRALLDSAAILRPAALEDLVDEAFCAGVSHPDAVRAAIARAAIGRGRRGVEHLRGAIEAWGPDIRPGSPAEMRLVRLLRDWGYPDPNLQITIREPDGEPIGRIDLGWPTRRVGLEYDSDRWHNPRQWARDEHRHQRYVAVGWRVHRVDKHDLRAGNARLRALLDVALAALAV